LVESIFINGKESSSLNSLTSFDSISILPYRGYFGSLTIDVNVTIYKLTHMPIYETKIIRFNAYIYEKGRMIVISVGDEVIIYRNNSGHASGMIISEDVDNALDLNVFLLTPHVVKSIRVNSTWIVSDSTMDMQNVFLIPSAFGSFELEVQVDGIAGGVFDMFLIARARQSQLLGKSYNITERIGLIIPRVFTSSSNTTLYENNEYGLSQTNLTLTLSVPTTDTVYVHFKSENLIVIPSQIAMMHNSTVSVAAVNNCFDRDQSFYPTL